MFHVPETYRITDGKSPIYRGKGNNGVFLIPNKKDFLKFKTYLQAIAMEVNGWEIVSVCILNYNRSKVVERTPTWEEMADVKQHFWAADDPVIQIHTGLPKKEKEKKYVLVLFRKIGSQYDYPAL